MFQAAKLITFFSGPVSTIHFAVIEKISFQWIACMLCDCYEVEFDVFNTHRVDDKLVVIKQLVFSRLGMTNCLPTTRDCRADRT
ncbi:hypothetical protein A3197_06325 [Candidatus Thiodiazotropha endoloripes]|nr:hypothetical protein A3197_06325 [Candidatus Thiodiazotropha endoloripes]